MKVVIDDIDYEIYCTETYLDYLQENIKRLTKAQKYYDKMMSAPNEKKKEFFREYVQIYLDQNETVDAVPEIKGEYEKAYELRKNKIDTLHEEIKKIKKLKI